MKAPKRAGVAGAYVPAPVGRLRRSCPICQSKPGHRCYSTTYSLYPKPLKKPHPQR